ncbi:MAG: amidohydrolase [Acidobacteria bacterium]|nr:amidohydrolase [Acidobacteriota bacterium]MDA1234985.1 amidohydrolase [Acidobacteriota bacterium]
MRLSLLTVTVAVLVLQGQTASPDLVLLGGKVFTGDSTRPFAEAIAVLGDRVLAVGTAAEIEALTDGHTQRIELAGRVVIPGIYDAHFHSLMTPVGGRQLSFDDLDPSWAQTRAAVERAAQEAEAGTWVLGSVGPTVILSPDVTRQALDRIAPRNPVYLTTHYGHGDLFNTAAMEALGLGEREPDPPGGRFEREADSQRLNGKAWEYAQWGLRRRLARLVPDDVIKDSLRASSEQMLRFGITSVDDMPFLDMARYVELREEIASPIRLRAISMPIPGAPEPRQTCPTADGRVTLEGTKWILDGTPFEHGVALRGHYHDAPDRSGRMNFSASEIGSMIDEAISVNRPLLLHAAGDLTVDTVLQLMEQRADVDWKQRRVRIEHGDGVASDLIRRARDMGIVVVQNPTHFSLVELVTARYGADTSFFPLRTLLEQGVPIALGSDGPFNPYLNIMLASLHPARPSEAITREQAVEAYTRGSAYAAFVENERGLLEPGKLADLAVLTQDIFAVPPQKLPATESALTLIGGRIVYGSLP